eukprot:TRINITY_DN1826_c0_g1_i2.p1 TRINITY_DN1826_c0_g1~~TRINITY_DN1826_c0_g1_i2.p1  ORF type:complete len:120 (+),score=2.35 TRINITY_DN1826_c0_g1_i2:121-480(+)
MRKWQIIMAVLCWLCVRGHASRVVIEELPLTKQHSFGVKKCKAYSLPANYKIVKLKVEILLDGFVMVTDKKLTSLSKEAISKCQDDMIVCASKTFSHPKFTSSRPRSFVSHRNDFQNMC